MARGSDTSCAGIGCAGFLLLAVVVPTVGYLLALPLVLPDLLAEQTPPQRLHGFGQYLVVYAFPVLTALALALYAGRGRRRRSVWWPAPVRAAGLLAAVAPVLWWVEGRVGDLPAWNVRAVAEGTAAGLVALAFVGAVRRWGGSRWLGGGRPWGGFRLRRRTPADQRRPAAGEIWLAMVPLREDPERQLRHYCVVLATHAGHADVAQITSKDKDGRSDHIWLPNDGWDTTSGRDHWVEVGREPRRVEYGLFLTSRPQGSCPAEVWRELGRRPG
ncbi:hypothetical protein [Streptomyces sp. H27-S2]|uniref:hypothetical protein n=1 Tax=Streptomyces antarcticus TaxID=2996458 RepID=UPI00226EB2CB|nr:hypothetical protein [Streptomyces sp. H27-S2]MCY0951950.1 hypothetical protein [Streptomyces sp. H27-S2]